MQLQIRHVKPTDDDGKPIFPDSKPRFEVVRLPEGRTASAVALTPPGEVAIGASGVSLTDGLRWYLEQFLKLPDDSFRARAKEVQDTLAQWGRDCFVALFGSGEARDWYRDAQREGLENLRIKVASDDPGVMSWPWEALESADGAYCLAQKCRFERQQPNYDPPPLSGKAGGKEINILYIIARPSGEKDIEFQTMIRPLLDFVDKNRKPVHIDLLRPPTFEHLQAELDEKRNFYHIVHFDGHGSYEPDGGVPTGYLYFESDDGARKRISADALGKLLFGHNIPIMVLDACQSGMVDANAGSVFASVAGRLLKAGIRSVVAMSYSLYTSADKVFIPAFYGSLIETGDVGEAMRTARAKMNVTNERDGAFGMEPLQDWIVPVLYQQAADGERLLPNLPESAAARKRESKLPPEAREIGIYGFIGRDRSIQRLESAIRLNPAGILIHGMAGEGKTTLVKGFLQWLEATNGIGNGALWLSFEDTRVAANIVNEMVIAIFGAQAVALPDDQKYEALVEKLKYNRYFIVWDNFESVSGITGGAAAPSDDDRKTLTRKLGKLLADLRGGKTKVLITSRSPERWLLPSECYSLPLEGLKGEERWEYCNAIVRDMGIKIDRKSKSGTDAKTYEKLMEKLDGNPLSIRAILLRLRDKSAAALLAELETAFVGMEGDEGMRRIQAALSVFESGLAPDFAPTLRLLGLHEHFASANLISAMLQKTGETAAPINDCFASLESAGLCRHIGYNVYQTHPALRDFLSRRHPADEAGKRAFVDMMGNIADEYAEKELHEQRGVFHLFGASFNHALTMAQNLDMRVDVLALMWGLASYAENTRNFDEAERLYARRAEAAKEYGNASSEAASLGQLGSIAVERHDLKAAEDWYRLVLDVFQKSNDEKNTAVAYHQLGYIAQERRNFEAAENWYGQSLAIRLKLGDEHGAASTYHQLGMVAQERRDFEAAENWYGQSLAIFLKLGDEHGAASTYHQLGIVAQERRDFEAAENWYGQSLAIKLKLGDEHGAALTYGQLGRVAEERGDFEAAENLYKQALATFTRLNDPYSADMAKHDLARLDEKRK